MKAGKIILAVALVALMASNASAVNKVWWQATAVSGPASVIQQGITTPGSSAGTTQTLELECDVSAGGATRCEWDVVMNLRNEEAAFSWATDLSTDDLTVSAKTSTYGDVKKGTPYPFPYPDNANLKLGAGPMLVDNASALAPGGAATYYYGLHNFQTANGYHTIFTFRLSKDKQVPTAGLSEIFGSTGAGAWAIGPTAVGPNPAANISNPGTAYALPVITINNVPEPATIALLGFGAFCLIRRRR